MNTSLRRLQPSPAMAVALIALFVALGGTSYAALKLPKGSVGTAQLRNNAVTGAKVKPRTLSTSDFNRASLRSMRGPKGDKGDTGGQGAAGAPGTALAYARIVGTVDANHSKGITNANLTHPADGVFCFRGLPFTPQNVIVTPLPGYSAQQGTADLGQNHVSCPADTQATVLWVIGSTLTDALFMILVN